ncbi:hypothetical protein K438DRAFT_1490047, partial [Mycena galopus ATCC 62051]
IISSQDYVSKAMTRKLVQWEREGWVGVRYSEVLKCLAAELKARSAKTTFVSAPKSPEARILSQEATRQARIGAGNGTRDIDLSVPAGTNLTGVRIQGNRQKTFYRGIREIKTHKLGSRASTDIKLTEVKESMKNIQDRVFTDEEIWRALRNRDFSPRTAQFLWRAMHNAHRVGKYWKYIPECQDRATCQECGEIEDLEHILINCKSPGQEIVWKAAERLWLEKESEWPGISLGSILGCGLLQFRDEKGKLKRGTQRMYRILVSESAYTVWKLRNERVISRAGDPLDESAIMNKWIYGINQRLQQDVVLANRSAKGNRPRLDPTLVKDTWANTLDDEGKLPNNWLKEARVLVGRRALTRNQ